MLTDRLIVFFWTIFCGYWAFASLSTNAKGSRLYPWFRPVQFLIPTAALGYVALSGKKFPQHDLSFAGAGILGALLCALGVGIAIWARACLGDNWGMPMTQRESPQLITSGPYACVRHPIYSGILLAIVGTILAAHAAILTGWFVAFVYFAVCAKKEERDMLNKFPEHYRCYMSRTKRLIPFVW